MRKIKRNAARCLKCETVIESKHRHDYVMCPCKNLSVDGGLDYLRRGAMDLADYEELSEFDESPVEEMSRRASGDGGE